MGRLSLLPRVSLACGVLCCVLVVTLASRVVLHPCVRAAEAAEPLSAHRRSTLARLDSLWRGRAAEDAAALIETELPRARATGDSIYLMRLVLRRGHMRVALGDNPGAEPDLREALTLATALRDSLHECVGLRWLGVALATQGRMGEARRTYEELLEKAVAYGNGEHEAWAAFGIAYDAWVRGDLDAARSGHEHAAALFRREHLPRGELMVLNGLGNILNDLGAYDDARACYTRTARVAREIGFLFVEAIAENNLGTLEYSLGDPGRALEHFQRAYDLHRQDGSLRESVIPAANLVECRTTLGRYREAIADLEPLLAECRAGGYRDLEATVLERIADVRGAQGRLRQAARLYRQALATCDELPVDDRAEILLSLSRTLATQDSTRAALGLLRAHESWASNLDSPFLRLLFEVERGACELDAGELEAALARLTRAAAAADTLGQLAWRLRALSLAGSAAHRLGRFERSLELLAAAAVTWETEREVPLDPEWREQRGAAARDIYTSLGMTLLANPGGGDPARRVRHAFDRLQIFKARTLLERMLRPGGRPATAPPLDPSPATVTLEALQDAVLRPGELLLDCFVGPDASLLFAVTRDTCRAVQLPPAKRIDAAVHLLHELLTGVPEVDGDRDASPAPALIEYASAEVSAMLLGQVTDLVRGSTAILFAPDGSLNLLPLAVLPLADRHVVQQIPSATVLARLRAKAPRAPGPARRLLAVRGLRSADGRRLRGAEREIGHLRTRFRDVQVTSGDGVVDWATALSAHDLLHFAAHSSVDDQAPWRSSIDVGGNALRDGAVTTSAGMTGKSDEEFAAPLTAAGIATMQLEARLVVLSSCASAGGRILSGEGVQGLTGAFLSAGAQVVVATLWAVDDDVTARLMATFYDALAAGVDVGTALAGARRAVREEPRTAHPFFWAGFVVVGDGTVRVDLRAERRPAAAVRGLLVGAGLLVTLLGGRAWRRRRMVGVGRGRPLPT